MAGENSDVVVGSDFASPDLSFESRAALLQPAVPRQLGEWAEELPLPNPLYRLYRGRRDTLTHTSRTGFTFGSRKWMSGQAAALVALNDRWPFANATASSLRAPLL